ncbi:hypothetical protein D9756_003130 [Leucocoprinus leucothites]|uniref:NAD-dependent epimerase/dehydratase domain-containing protein n=1 Tax=Leucocoprinus leucothites TaxID=201217 RepID=A0A8H5LJ83_9AGAR|nr:hypothetical protein D9756_003130 [Leucoagaricus leucothites]
MLHFSINNFNWSNTYIIPSLSESPDVLALSHEHLTVGHHSIRRLFVPPLTIHTILSSVTFATITYFMKLVITSCNGSVGVRVVLLALKRGHTVTGADHTSLSPELSNLEKDQQDRFTFHQIDLKEYDRTLELLQNSGCEAVVHLAAIRNPLDYKVQTHNSNVVLSWNILRACAELGITRIAQASSVNVITGIFSVQQTHRYFPIDENHPTEPDEPYGLSKVICELQAATITRRYPTLRIASLRLHWSLPYGQYPSEGKEDAAARDLWGYLDQDSGAEAFLFALTCDTSRWPSKAEAFYIASPTIGPDKDSRELKAKFWPDVPVKEGFEISGRKGFFDCSKAERLLGWVHKDNIVPE